MYIYRANGGGVLFGPDESCMCGSRCQSLDGPDDDPIHWTLIMRSRDDIVSVRTIVKGDY